MSPWIYVWFLTFVAIVLMLDLGVFHRKIKEESVQEALLWTAFWVSLAMLFLPVVYFMYKYQWLGVGTVTDPVMKEILTPMKAVKVFLTGYLAEEALSLDNIFVIAVVLTFFQVPGKYQHRVLFWGIIGAVVLRGVMIGVGTKLVERFEFMNYIFGAVLVYTAIKMLRTEEEPEDMEQNWVVRWTRKLFPVTKELHGEKFFVRHSGKIMATPLFLVLVIVDFLDVVFAVDSIPAILSITGDPFLVFTSNIFAILGLRSLYFALAAMMKLFRYLKYSLVGLLGFLGVKMLLQRYIEHMAPSNKVFYWIDEHSITISLVVIVTLLGGGVVASLLIKEKVIPTKEENNHAHGNVPCGR